MKNTFVALVLAVSLFDLTAAFICPTEYGFYRNPKDPHKFFECVAGHDYEYTCPANLVFNESIQACDYTTGPVVVHTTPQAPTVPHGTRHRHTLEPTTEMNSDLSSTTNEDEITSVPNTTEEPASTRSRHH